MRCSRAGKGRSPKQRRVLNGRRLFPCGKAILFAGALALQLHRASAGAERVPLKVVVNEEEKGEFFLLLEDDGDVQLPSEDLRSLGLVKLPADAAAVEGYVSLNSLAPKLRYTIDEADASLRITADPGFFETHVLDLGPKRRANVISGEASSVVFNYAVDYNAGNGVDFLSLNLPFEVAARYRGALFLSNFSYVKTGAEDRFTRMMSSVIFDDPRRLVRHTLGDFVGSSGELGSVGNFGGVNVSKNFSLNPYFVQTPDLPLSGVAQTPSEIEVYVNGELVKEEKLHPGGFSIENLPFMSGAGSTAIVIRDAFGREERITNPYYFSQLVLKKGLHEYSYSAGFRRQDFGVESFAYGDPAFLGFHRYGFSRRFTGGLHGEADGDTVNFGPTLNAVTGHAGEVSFAGAVSADKGRFGNAASASYSYNTQGFSGMVSLKQYSTWYANLALAAADVKPRWAGSAGVGLYGKHFGSISLNGSYAKLHGGGQTNTLFAVYSHLVFKEATLLARVQRVDAGEVFYEAFFGMNASFGHKTSGTASFANEGGKARASASIQKQAPSGTGFGYSADIDVQESLGRAWDADGAFSALYKGRRGEYSGEYRRSGGADAYKLGVAGSMVLVDHSAFLSRPVIDSFALVKVNDLKGVGVDHNNEKVAVTNRRGEAVVPDLMSYSENEISLTVNDLPLNYNLSETNRYVAPPYRGGSFVPFGVEKIQAVVGKLFVDIKGKKTPAEFAGLELTVGGKKTETVVGTGGEFYLENVPPGTYQARLFTEEWECGFELTVPESAEIVVDLRDIVCGEVTQRTSAD